MPKYRVNFDDGTSEVVEAESPEAAQAMAMGETPIEAPVEAPQEPGFFPNTGLGDVGRWATGLGETGLQMATGGIASPLSGLAGIGAAALPGGMTGPEAVESVQSSLTYAPRTEEGQAYTEGLGRLFEPVEQFADWAGEATGDPEDVLGATAVKTAILGAPSVIGGRMLMNRAKTGRKPIQPTSDELLEAGSAAAKRVDEAGAVIKPERLVDVAERINRKVTREGIDKGLEPRASRVMKRVLEDATSPEPLKFREAYTLRRIAQRAMEGGDRGDIRFARIIRDELDNFLDDLGPDDVIRGEAVAASENIRQMKEFWRRGRTGEEIDELIDRAGVQAGQFSGSGFENALRTQFRQVALNRNKIRRFQPEVQDAIKKVAMGGPLDNFYRAIGKFAPTGALSAVISGGAGAAMFGAPGAVAVPAIGAGARQLATRRTLSNAQKASEIARSGRLLIPEE